MNPTEDRPVPVPRDGLPNRCFACGQDNPAGLKLVFTHQPEGAADAVWVPGQEHQGWPGVVHGGLLSTVLDEAMSHAVLAAGLKAMTAELRVRFRRPAPPGGELRIRGWVVQRARRLVEAEASLTDSGGAEYAHGWGRFFAFDAASESPAASPPPD